MVRREGGGVPSVLPAAGRGAASVCGEDHRTLSFPWHALNKSSLQADGKSEKLRPTLTKGEPVGASGLICAFSDATLDRLRSVCAAAVARAAQ